MNKENASKGLNEPIDFEKVFEVQVDLHIRKKNNNQGTPKLGKAILPEIITKIGNAG